MLIIERTSLHIYMIPRTAVPGSSVPGTLYFALLIVVDARRVQHEDT